MTAFFMAAMLAKQSARAFHNPMAKVPCRGAFTAGRAMPSGGAVRSSNQRPGEGRPSNPFRFFSSSSVDIEDDLNLKIKAKGDEIRQLKADGVDKATLAPYVQELQALKAQLPPSPDKEPAAKKQQATKQEKQKKANVQNANSNKKVVEEMSESELRLNRLAKIEAMKEANVEPFEYTFQCNRSAAKLAAEYDGRLVDGEEDKESDVAVAGRIMTRRVFGKLAFITLQDETGIIQLQFDAERLGDSFKVRSQYIDIL